MHIKAAQAILESVRIREQQGDCPTEPAQSVETLENCLLTVAQQLTEAQADREDAERWRAVRSTLHPASCSPRDGYYMTTEEFMDAPMPSATEYADRLRVLASSSAAIINCWHEDGICDCGPERSGISDAQADEIDAARASSSESGT